MLAAYKTGSEIVSPGRPDCLIPNLVQLQGELKVKGWLKAALPKLAALSGSIGPVVAQSTADQEVSGSNLTLA